MAIDGPGGGRMPRVTRVVRQRVRLPFRDRVREWNDLYVAGFAAVDVFRLDTEDTDIVGWGTQLAAETDQTRTTDRPPLDAFAGVNPAQLMATESWGIGFQTAVYDAVGKCADVPLHRLLAMPVVREHVPLAWWNTKSPPELLAEEAADALAEGYLAHKLKARPWFDVYEQVEAISAVTPEWFGLDLDWNQMLLTASNAAGVLAALERYARVRIFETPIRQRDNEGYRRLRDKISLPIVEHFLETPFPLAIAGEAFDGFVVSGLTIGELLRQGLLAGAFNKPCWLQLVGPGPTTALLLHVAAVLENATWPSVSCLNTYAEDLLTEPIRLSGGLAAVPTGPGLGVRVDPEKVARYAVDDEADYAEPRGPRRVLTMSLPGDRFRQYVSIKQLWQDCLRGNVPPAERGARLDIRADDGSAEFRRTHELASRAPIVAGNWAIGNPVIGTG